MILRLPHQLTNQLHDMQAAMSISQSCDAIYHQSITGLLQALQPNRTVCSDRRIHDSSATPALTK